MSTAIAVVGVACRFPDAWTAEQFWHNIDNGVVSTKELSDETLRAAGVPDDALRADDYVRVSASMPGAEDFAADFFGYPPREAELIDPQQRVLLEACWEALESAGHPPSQDGPSTGVFAAAGFSHYTAALQLVRARRFGAAAFDMELNLGGQVDYAASRVAYKLGLRGPSVTVQTACSSSLTAVHYATLSLLAGECDLALAGGAGFVAPATGYRYQAGGILSRDGYCRSFDIRSTGSAIGAGVGVVALRRLADALADGDDIIAVIHGSAAGNDGADRPGFTAPSPAGPASVVRTALSVASVPGEALRYVEAHGSGTPLGDHVELVGLTDALRATSSANGYCGLGSVKSNIGHADAAAGIAGLIKALHVVRTGNLPPHPLLERPRDAGLLAASPFYLSAEPGTCTDPDRHVLVNSMGLGGTNAAVVLGPPPAPARQPAPERDVVRLVLSARTRRELDEASRRLADELDRGRAPIADVAHTLRVGRTHFTERRVVTGPPETLTAALRLPRPPTASTMRAEPRQAFVVVDPGFAQPAPLLDTLVAALGREAVVDQPPASDGFVIVVGDAEPSPSRYVLREPDQLDEALCTAWQHGVAVDWAAVAAQRGRRVALPTYPFERRRYWALDPSALRPVEMVAADTVPPHATDDVQASLLDLWRNLFGKAVGPDDEFGALGGTSLLAVRMALEIQQRHGLLLNLHRLGGSRATVRRIAEVIRARAAAGSAHATAAERAEVADGDAGLVDADVELPLGPLAPARDHPGPDVLLTGATGFVGAFLLHALLDHRQGTVHCLVRAADADQGWQRLRATARRYELPEPDPNRVRILPGELDSALDHLLDSALAERVGHVVHAAARVSFTEPYRVLRDPDVTGTGALLRWMRGNGVADLSYVSSIAACGPALGTDGTLLETRAQPLDSEHGGYGVVKWVCERLLERAEQDGMRVRVFRPGFILGATDTGACNTRDVVWRILAGGLAIGAHPLDDRPLAVAPVDVVAAAIVELGAAPHSVGRVYHLVDRHMVSPQWLFAGLGTKGLPLDKWQRQVAELALSSGDEVLSSVALYELESRHYEHVECPGWQDWLALTGRSSTVDEEALRASVRYLADQPTYRHLLTSLRQEVR